MGFRFFVTDLRFPHLPKNKGLGFLASFPPLP